MASTSSSVRLRAKTRIYLVGHSSQQIIGNKLPSNHQVLKSLFYNMREVGLPLCDAAKLTLKEVYVFWEKARIPCQMPKNAARKVEKLYNEWRSLQRNSALKTKCQEGKNLAFKSKLPDLFDVAVEDAISKMSNKEDVQFLEYQRMKGRKGHMEGVDRNTALADQRRVEREKRREEIESKEEQRRLQTSVSDAAESMQGNSESFESEVEEMSSGEEFIDDEKIDKANAAKKKKTVPSRGQKEVMTEKLSILLDRCRISDKNAVRIIFATAESLGSNVDELALSTSTIRKRRISFREQRAHKIKARFRNSDLKGCFVHLDGKMLPKLLQKDCTERLAILVSKGDEEQLLAVPELENSTGFCQAEAVIGCLEEWDVRDKIVGMCFVTTASNTGRMKGACTLLEKELGRPLLHLACRHHILEVVLRSVFEYKMGSTTAPQPDIFRKFQIHWPNIDQSKYLEGVKDDSVKRSVKEFEKDVSEFLRLQLTEKLPRDDYLEFIKLCLIFLGKLPSHDVSFRSPGAYHHARWMAKAIYSLKIFIFREQFPMYKEEFSSIKVICLFIVNLYVKMWCQASNAISAPNNDLMCIRNVIKSKRFDRGLSEKVLGKYLHHLWYLNPELICFSLFDKNVSNELKGKIAQKILSYKDLTEDDRSPRIVRVQVSEKEAVKFFKNVSLEEFISDQSLVFFEYFNVGTDFLAEAPMSWFDNKDFLKLQTFVRSIKVVNDTAGRGVKLIQDFNNTLTKDEEQTQFLLQVVADCRRLYPDASKCTLSQPVSDD